MGILHGPVDVISSNSLADIRHKGSFEKSCKYLEIAKGEDYEIIAGGKGFTVSVSF